MAKNKKIKSIRQRINELIDDQICLMFVIDGIQKNADKIIANEEKVRELMKNHVINPDAWINAAKICKEAIEPKA